VTQSEPSRTQFDLSWRMFGIPVRIHPMFWLLGLVLGWPLTRDPDRGLSHLAVFIVCMLVSILVHELGHVLMGMAFGARSYIVLYGFGGLAVGSLDIREAWKRIAVLLAGPGAGFLLFAVVNAVRPSVSEAESPLLRGALDYLWWMNLVWNVLNLFPIWPLDGGRICGELLMLSLGRRRGLRVALVISIALALLVALRAFFPEAVPVRIPYMNQRDPLAGVLLLWLAYGNVQDLLELNQDRRDWR
jgi:Zn-dependent protease